MRWALPRLGLRSRRILPRHLTVIVAFTFVGALMLMLRISVDTETRRSVRMKYNKIASSLGVPGHPPTYRRFRAQEASLPQHSLELPYPEGKNGRYVKFSNQANWIGWNNCFGEVLMNAHLAYLSNRAYVFRDYLWPATHYPWPPNKWHEDYPRNPLSSIVSGPVAGGPFEPGDPAPRAVSEAWFDVVCPPERRRYINTRDVKPAVSNASGLVVLQHWQNILLDAPESCIEVVPASLDEDMFSQTFDLGLWGSTRLFSLWESFSASPISRLLEPSSIVRAAVESNAHLFVPRGASPAHPPSRDPYKHLMAVHLRRGDYEEHCKWMAYLNAGFYGWNQITALPDHFANDPFAPDKDATFLGHCWPYIDQIVAKVRIARKDFAKTDGLDAVYIATNEKGGWLGEMMNALRKDGWAVSSSQDLVLDAEQLGVSMSVDMEIARRAAVFVGNGISSFTSNIVYRRLAEGRDPISIRFW